MTDQLVLGSKGEVGAAMVEVLGCDGRDIEDPGNLLDRYEVLHVCYNWQIPTFFQTTHEYAEQYNADLVVVHSTVPIGTCDPEGWVHSPVRGKHPDLAAGLCNFTKHFGGESAEWAASLWTPSCTQVHAKAATTEAAKLFELCAYGVEITLQKEVYTYCQDHDLPFDEVYTDFGNSYNDGWFLLRQEHFTKPILQHVPGPIGGHCVRAAAEILGRWDSFMADYVLSIEEFLL